MNRTKRVTLAIGVASLGLLAGAWVLRSPRAALEASPPAKAPLPAPESEQQARVDEELRNAVASEGREAILRKTEDILCLSPEEARAFRSATLSAVEEVNRAWEVREAGWIAVSSSAASDPELLARLEGEIQFRYESEKERALRRLAAQLGTGERSKRIQEGLEEWFDSVR